MFKAGDTIGKYTVKRLLGKGGMGAVFLCSDPDLDRDVAVKVINPQLQGVENVLKRFDVEARAVAQLDSSFIVKVYEFNREATPSFLVMEYVPGQCLLELLKDKGAQELDTVTSCARDVLKALQVAHDGGVIHRDVKPANILHAASGVFKLMDFGLARSLDVESRLTVEGTTMGTITYLAPEVARGDPATFRSDLYSLGVTLYEMLTGNPPLEDKSPLKLLYRLANEPLPPISAVRDDLPPAFAAWLGKMLSHSDAGRYETAASALADLEKVAAINGMTEENAAQLTAAIISSGVQQEEEPIDLAAVTVIIRRAQEIESQNRDVLSEESLLEIARDLNITTGAVRKAVLEHQSEMVMAAGGFPHAKRKQRRSKSAKALIAGAILFSGGLVLGLGATIIGMLQSFNSASESGAASAGQLATGIGSSLIFTIFGIPVSLIGFCIFIWGLITYFGEKRQKQSDTAAGDSPRGRHENGIHGHERRAGRSRLSGCLLAFLILAGISFVFLVMAVMLLTPSSGKPKRIFASSHTVWTKEAIFSHLRKEGIFKNPKFESWNYQGSIGSNSAEIKCESGTGDRFTYSSVTNSVSGVTAEGRPFHFILPTANSDQSPLKPSLNPKEAPTVNKVPIVVPFPRPVDR